MGRRSTVAALPDEVRQEVDRLIRGGRTIVEILETLRGLGVGGISQSAMGRYKMRAEEQLVKYRQAQEIGAVWVDALRENPHGGMGIMLSETIKLLANQAVSEIDGTGETPDIRDIAMLARTAKDLAAADKLGVDRMARLREEIRREEQEKMARKLDQLKESGGKEGGIDLATLERVRGIYGL